MFCELLKSQDINLFISENIDEIWAFCNSTYKKVEEEKKCVKEFVLLNLASIQSLDFSVDQNRAFLFLLYDLCERLEDAESMQQLWHILKSNNIATGTRLLAANIFSFQITFTHELIDQFENICENLVFALENEEDNDKKVLATFTNYYLAVLSRQKKWIGLLRDKILNSSDKYPFLSSEFISKLLSFDITKFHESSNNIQNLKDELFGRIDVLPRPKIEDFIIEESEYANTIATIEDITFQHLRNIAKENIHGSFQLGNRGVTPLAYEQELFIYFRNYGNMHYAKMISSLEAFPLIIFGKDIEIIDWGCGQAIATISLFEYLKERYITIKPRITLIEPSKIALKRASLHCKIFNPDSQIKTVCKYLDELEIEDIATKSENIKFHLFSNILDIELFSMSNLLRLISSTQKGINYFICVSPYINDVKAYRIDSFKRYFEQRYKSSFELIDSMQNTNGEGDEYWNCNNNYNGNFNGRFCQHGPHQWCGCDDQWTRVIRVFKVEL